MVGFAAQTNWSTTEDTRRAGTGDRFAASVGSIALCLFMGALAMSAPSVQPSDAPVASATASAPSAASKRSAALDGRDIVIGGYGGMTDTLNSTVAIVKPGAIDMTVKDFTWLGQPFKAPIYYGVRIQHWSPVTGFGGMVDFIHAKAIARAADEATFTGTRDGKPVDPKAKIGDVFRHLEFTHGHNMLTYNGLFRWPAFATRFRPYIGLGAGISLPHTEIGFIDKNTRTYEYQYAGLVGQVLGGIEINLGRSSIFFEYKFSYAPYEVPLSQEAQGFVLVTDIWRQFRAWALGETPAGGRLATTLATHHGVSGILVRLGSTVGATPSSSR